FHPLQGGGDLLTASLTGESEGARGVPAPADGKHRGIEERLHEDITNCAMVEITEDLVEREGVLGAEREDDGVVGGGGLQFEVEGAAKSFAQRQAPGAVEPGPERGMDDQLHAARLV